MDTLELVSVHTYITQVAEKFDLRTTMLVRVVSHKIESGTETLMHCLTKNTVVAERDASGINSCMNSFTSWDMSSLFPVSVPYAKLIYPCVLALITKFTHNILFQPFARKQIIFLKVCA